MNSKKYLPYQVFAVFLCGLLVGKFCFGTSKEGIGISLFNGKPSKLQSVINLIDSRYVDRIDTDSLTELVIPDIFTKLDPHSKYVPYEKREQSERTAKGRFCGIGMEYAFINDSVTVIYTLPDGPCQKAGVLPGDNVVSIDSVRLFAGKSDRSLVSSLVAGGEGTSVRLGVMRPGTDSVLFFNVMRGEIPLKSVPAAFMADSLTGYVKITSFGERTYGEFCKCLSAFRKADVKNLVIDLRDNGGGLLGVVQTVVSEVLDTGDTIVYTEKRGRETEYMLIDTVQNPLCKGMRIICLVNFSSASASEIMAGAIQDNDRGVILGRRTFGKGLVQTPIALSDNSIVRLTTSRYYTPSGRSFQKSYKDYGSDYSNRLKNGEFDSASAFKIPDSHIYFTKHGRKVYSGSGVMPDFFVAAAKASPPLLYKLDSAMAYAKFTARKYNAAVQKDGQTTGGASFFSELFSGEKPLMEDFWSFAVSSGIISDGKKEKKAFWGFKDGIITRLKASAWHVLGREDSSYRYFYYFDPDIDSAKSLFRDREKFDKLLTP